MQEPAIFVVRAKLALRMICDPYQGKLQQTLEHLKAMHRDGEYGLICEAKMRTVSTEAPRALL